MILRPKKWSSSRLINLVKRSRRIKNFWFYSLIQWAQSSRWTLRKESRNFGGNMLNRSLNYTIYVIVSNLRFEHKIWYFLHFFWMFLSTVGKNYQIITFFQSSRHCKFWNLFMLSKISEPHIAMHSKTTKNFEKWKHIT